jgi:hypothetical protein
MFLHEPRALGRLDPLLFGLRYNIDALVQVGDSKLLSLCMSAFEGKLGVEHYAYVRDCPDEKIRELALFYFSMRFHEARHFHDLLATPYGSQLMVEHFTIAAFLSLCFPILRETKVFYAPLMEWQPLSEFLQTIYPDLPAPPPILNACLNLVRKSQDAQRLISISDAFALSEQLGNLTTESILECSAVMVQEIACHEFIGGGELQVGNYIRNKPGGIAYYAPMLALEAAVGGKVPREMVLEACYLSLFSAPGDHGGWATPHENFINLCLYVGTNECDGDLARAGEAIYKFLQIYCKASSPAKGLRALLKQASLDRKARIKYLTEEISKHFGEIPQEVKLIIRCFRDFDRAADYTAKAVLARLGEYCSGVYLDELWPDLPSPIYYIETETGVLMDNKNAKQFNVLCSAKISRMVADEYKDTDLITAFLFAGRHKKRKRDLNTRAWHRNVANMNVLLFLLLGESASLLSPQREAILQSLTSAGFDIYTERGARHRMG